MNFLILLPFIDGRALFALSGWVCAAIRRAYAQGTTDRNRPPTPYGRNSGEMYRSETAIEQGGLNYDFRHR